MAAKKIKQFKQLFNGEHKGFFIFSAVAVAIGIYVICFLPGTNFFTWIKAKNDIRRQNRQIEYYNSQIEEINREIETLSSDKDSLERFAREQYQYAEPGDDVYILKQE